MATVLDALEVDTSVHKELMGLMEGRPLHGDELIRGWQARAAAFPQAYGEPRLSITFGRYSPSGIQRRTCLAETLGSGWNRS